MPVSSPSYFPPNRANGSVVGITAGTDTTGSRNFLAMTEAGNQSSVSDLIIIGANAGENAIADANAQYSVLIGSKAGSQLNDFSGGASPGPAIVIGGNSLTQGLTGTSLILIGCNTFPLSTNPAGSPGGGATGNSVVIGHDIGSGIAAGNFTTHEDVLIGNGILESLTDPTYGGSVANVIIGCGAVNSLVSPSPASFIGNVVIGFGAAQPLKSPYNVIIGNQACVNYSGPNGNGYGVVAIGGNADISTNAVRNVVMIGCQTALSGGDRTVMIGTNVEFAAGAGNDNTIIGDATIRTYNWGGIAGVGCTFLGSNAGYLEPTGNNARFIAEYCDGGTLYGLLYGIMGAGNLLIGNSTPTGQAGANRDFGGTTSTNVLKLLNGTVGNANPVGGGYFYVNSGALHWVGTSGTDTTLASA